MDATTETPEQATVSRGREQGAQHSRQVPQTHCTGKDGGVAGAGAGAENECP